MIYLVSFVLVLGLTEGVANGDYWLQDEGPDGIVSVEAEHYDNKAPGQNGTGWEEVGPKGGFTGVIGMEVFNEGTNNTNYAAESARLDYEIKFAKTDTHYVWILAYGPDGGSDSCHSGLDGEEISTSDRMAGWGGDYEWNSHTMDSSARRPTFEVTSTGIHTLNIWMREDGLIVDKIILTTNPAYTPIGDGPAESKRGLFLKAYGPSPADGSLHEDTWVILSWSPGDTAVSHDVYFGDNFDDVNDGTGGTFQGNQAATSFRVGAARSPYLVAGTTYYWRIDEVDDLHPDSPWKGDVWSFWTPPRTAYDPYPVDDIDFIDPNVTLSWEPGFSAKLHTVYFGDNFANVNDADTSDTTGIYRGVESATTYTPGPLGLDSPYYWRVDEFDGDSTHKGNVWSFTTARSRAGTIASEVFVRVIGPEEIVFDWSTDRCEDRDGQDVPARAFRDADGKVQLLAHNLFNRRMIGNTLDSVERDCHIIMNSDDDPDPSKFNAREWIYSVYTLHGETIYALVHNEYHGDFYPGHCPSGDHKKCAYFAVTFAKSTDKGRTYSHPTAPHHLVASVPYPYEEHERLWGILAASNIVYNPNSGYYYALLRLRRRFLQEGGIGVMRTRTLDDPKSWRAWDGKDFSVRFINPYMEPDAEPAQHVCKVVSVREIQTMCASLTFNTYFNKFLLVDRALFWDPERKKRVPGFYYSLSDDLIHWKPWKLIMEARWQREFDWPGEVIKYPSLIDPSDTSRNFERTGQRPYLYHTRWRKGPGSDLVRVPIEFSHSPHPAPPPPGPSPDPLSEALDKAWRFTTGGSADWFGQTATSYYDGDAAQSGDISGSQDSWMQTTVSETGTVKFYWKVSSEEDYDFLEFYIDGSLQDQISGSVDWQQKTYTITTSGSHTLEWRYVKDDSNDSGSDCGWVDKVEWVTN